MRYSVIYFCIVFVIICTFSACNSASPTQNDMLLAKRALYLARKIENTPGRYVGHYITKNYFGRRSISILEGKREATHNQLLNTRKSIKKYIVFLELAQNWPTPISVDIPYTINKPIIDGNLNEPVWRNALTLKGLYFLNNIVKQDKPRTVWKIMWDENNMYFGAICYDKNIIASKLENSTDIFRHDNLAIFVMTNLRTGGYWEFIVDAFGNVFDSLITADRAKWKRISRHYEILKGAQVHVSVNGTLNNNIDQDESFTVEIALPFSELPGFMKGNKPQAGEIIAFMMARTDVFPKNITSKTKIYTITPILKTNHNTWNYINATLCK